MCPLRFSDVILSNWMVTQSEKGNEGRESESLLREDDEADREEFAVHEKAVKSEIYKLARSGDLRRLAMWIQGGFHVPLTLLQLAELIWRCFPPRLLNSAAR